MTYMFKCAVNYTVNTRNRNSAAPVFQRLTCTQHSVSFKGPFYWNKLPNYLKEIESLKLFRKKLKSFYLQQYEEAL